MEAYHWVSKLGKLCLESNQGPQGTKQERYLWAMPPAMFGTLSTRCSRVIPLCMNYSASNINRLENFGLTMKTTATTLVTATTTTTTASTSATMMAHKDIDRPSSYSRSSLLKVFVLRLGHFFIWWPRTLWCITWPIKTLPKWMTS